MTKYTGNKWETECCPVCYKEHKNYSGKLDSSGIEYVVAHNERCNISNPTWKKMATEQLNCKEGNND